MRFPLVLMLATLLGTVTEECIFCIAPVTAESHHFLAELTQMSVRQDDFQWGWEMVLGKQLLRWIEYNVYLRQGT
jgi:hypothetical protein